MAMSNAERQRQYRQRHLVDVDGLGHRLNLVVGAATGAQLERLARHYGVTKRSMIEQLLRQAESDIVDGMKPKARREYLG